MKILLLFIQKLQGDYYIFGWEITTGNVINENVIRQLGIDFLMKNKGWNLRHCVCKGYAKDIPFK